MTDFLAFFCKYVQEERGTEKEKKKKAEEKVIKKQKKRERQRDRDLCSLFYFPGEITICFQIDP